MLEFVILLLVLRYYNGPGLSGMTYESLDQWIEHKHRQRLWVVKLSCLLLLAACLYARVDVGCAYHGAHFAQLARNPFAFDSANPVACRILTPLISYALGLRAGCLNNLTVLLIAGAFIGVVYTYFKRHALRPGDAFVAAVVMVSSLPVLTSVYCGGYTDITTFLLVFLMWWFRERRWVFHLLFLLALFNHEWILFLVPWLVFISLQGHDRKRVRAVELLVGFGISIALYLAFRDYVTSHQEVRYSLSYYLTPLIEDPAKNFLITLPYHWLGWFSVFQALWLIPAVAAWHAWQNHQRRLVWSMGLLLVSVWAQLWVAGDTSRLFTLGFMVMPLALEYLFRTGAHRFHRWILWLLVLNLAIPQVYTAGKNVIVFSSASLAILEALTR